MNMKRSRLAPAWPVGRGSRLWREKAIFLLIILLTPHLSLAGELDLVVTEIMYDASGSDTSHEWVEFYNSGENDLLVTDSWRFFDSSNHKINFDPGTSTVASHEFFILADNAEQFLLDYPEFAGKLFDTVINLPNASSTLSLSFDNGVSYGVYEYYDSLWGANGDGYSLEKKDFYASSTDNWQVSGQLGGTPGQNNSEVLMVDNTEDAVEENEEQNIIIEDTQSWSGLFISEVMPNPEGSDDGEWIELYNSGAEILNLSGLQIKDATSRIFTLDSDSGLVMNLSANNYLLLPKDISGISLNNSFDQLSIISPAGELIDYIVYDQAREGQSYARSDNGFVWTKMPTPGLVNQIILNQPPVAQISVEGDFLLGEKINFSAEYSYDPEGQDLDYDWDFGDGKNSQQSEIKHSFEKVGSYTVVLMATDSEGLSDTAYFVVDIGFSELNLEAETASSTGEKNIDNFKLNLAEENLIISEFIPNPEGSDDNEWIELYNNSQQNIDLYNWYLDDGEGSSKMWPVPTSTIISPQNYLVFSREDTKLTLNNGGDSVRLLTPLKEVWQEVAYDKISEGQSYAFDNLNNEWSATYPSPGEANVFETVQAAETIYSVSDLYALEKNDQISVQGLVLSSPSANDRSLYLAEYDFSQVNFEEVIEIYSYYKNFPKLNSGQIITVAGQLSSVGSLPRVKIKEAQDIVVNDILLAVSQPEEILLENLSDDLLGDYIKVRGTVVKKNGQNIYLGGGIEENAMLRIYSQFSIKDLDIAKGDEIIVTGILMENNDNFKLLPLNSEDIVLSQKVLGSKVENVILDSQEISDNNVEVGQPFRQKQVKNILVYIMIFIGLISIIYYLKKRSGIRS